MALASKTQDHNTTTCDAVYEAYMIRVVLVRSLKPCYKSTVDIRLSPSGAAYDEYLLVFIMEQNLVGISSQNVFYACSSLSPLMIHMTRHMANRFAYLSYLLFFFVSYLPHTFQNRPAPFQGRTS